MACNEQVSIDQSTMAHTLKRMERDGLVRRLPDPLDGRRAIIWLTDREYPCATTWSLG
jgi:DNA-binding MarR family transcriptional regulator